MTLMAEQLDDLPEHLRDPIKVMERGRELLAKGWPRHQDSGDCWCHPTLDYTNPETGVQHWIHKGYQ